MTAPTAYHQIGKFVVYFQHVETAINEILVLLANADDEAILILVNELEYSQRLKTAVVMLARSVDLQHEPDLSAKAEFHSLMGELRSLGERRNDLVHSNYTQWFNVEGAPGLIRQNSKLRGSKGIREEDEEKLLPESFNTDFERLDGALQRLEAFRLKAIDWRYPNEAV